MEKNNISKKKKKKYNKKFLTIILVLSVCLITLGLLGSYFLSNRDVNDGMFNATTDNGKTTNNGRIKCSVSGCQSCSSNNYCSTCKSGYIITSGKCVKGNEYVIEYSCNGGSNPPSYQKVTLNKEYTLNENTCVRNGYYFEGWTDPTGKTWGNETYGKWNLTNGESGITKNRLVLKAKWTAKTAIKNDGKLRIYFLSMKRYDQYLIVANGKTIFIDGGYETKDDCGPNAVQFMKKLGVTKIDALIGSHMHNNHIDAHKYIIKNMTVKHVYYPVDPNTCGTDKTCKGRGSADPTELAKLIKQYKIPMTILKVAKNVKIEGITFDIIGPQTLVTYKTDPDNINSLNMILKFGKNKFYFSGDGIQEDAILKKYSKDELKVDVLKYPHHGQFNLSPEFLEAVDPDYIVIPHTRNLLSEYLNSKSRKVLNISDPEYLILGKNKYGNVLMISDGTNLTVNKHFNP